MTATTDNRELRAIERALETGRYYTAKYLERQSPSDDPDVESPLAQIDHAIASVRALLTRTEAGANDKRCEMCGFVGEEDPVIGCPRCKWDEMQPMDGAASPPMKEPSGHWSAGEIMEATAVLRGDAAPVADEAATVGAVWQPIESAPKDGTWIVMVNANSGKSATGVWREWPDYCGWVDWPYLHGDPTHWTHAPKETN